MPKASLREKCLKKNIHGLHGFSRIKKDIKNNYFSAALRLCAAPAGGQEKNIFSFGKIFAKKTKFLATIA
jgi:hypothetical protein